MNSLLPLTRLKEVLRKSEEWVDVHPEKRYKQVTVQLWGKGVALRNEVNGAEIAAKKRMIIHSQQFILSRIDARNGAFGIVPDSLEEGVVSNDFPVFNLDASMIIPNYLGWMCKTQNFITICKAASEGTTNRVRLKVDEFLESEIPLPSLDEQRRIVARIEELAARIEEARELRRRAVEDMQVVRDAIRIRLLKCKGPNIIGDYAKIQSGYAFKS
jgi:type I restriction enzyme S subunit